MLLLEYRLTRRGVCGRVRRARGWEEEGSVAGLEREGREEEAQISIYLLRPVIAQFNLERGCRVTPTCLTAVAA